MLKTGYLATCIGCGERLEFVFEKGDDGNAILKNENQSGYGSHSVDGYEQPVLFCGECYLTIEEYMKAEDWVSLAYIHNLDESLGRESWLHEMISSMAPAAASSMGIREANTIHARTRSTNHLSLDKEAWRTMAEAVRRGLLDEPCPLCKDPRKGGTVGQNVIIARSNKDDFKGPGSKMLFTWCHACHTKIYLLNDDGTHAFAANDEMSFVVDMVQQGSSADS